MKARGNLHIIKTFGMTFLEEEHISEGKESPGILQKEGLSPNCRLRILKIRVETCTSMPHSDSALVELWCSNDT